VDRRAAHLLRRLDETEGEQLLSAVTARNEVVVEGHSVGHVEGFRFVPDPVAEGPEKRMVLRAARRALRAWMPLRVQEVEAAEDAAFGWTAQHMLTWNQVPIGRLRPGPSFVQPAIEVLDSEYLDGPARERIRVRLNHLVQARVAADLAPLFAAAAAAARDAALRGPMHRVLEAGGVVAGATESDIPPGLRGPLKAVGVRAGRFALFLPAALKPRAVAMRATLWALRQGVATPVLPAPGLVSCPLPADWPPGFAAAMGWVLAGPVLLRLDIAERVVAELSFAARRSRIAVPADLASRLAVSATHLTAVLHGLGIRMAPHAVLPPDQFGPPAPPMLMPPRPTRARPAVVVTPPRPDNPFAALAALRR
jgi:ATP-dependent RNA helicase SUPV3L1/SUV3